MLNKSQPDVAGRILSVLEKLNAKSVKQAKDHTLTCKIVPPETEFGGIRKVKISIFELAPNQTKIIIESRPTLFIQIIDYAINFKTVQAIIKSLKEA